LFFLICPLKRERFLQANFVNKEEQMKKTTRREFFIDSAVMIGGILGTVTFANGLLFPKAGRTAPVQFPESNCGQENKASKKVLVAYFSYCGTTGGVAEAIGQVLCDKGATVDVRLIKNISDVSSYQAFIIGSAVRSASWWPEAIEFVERNKEELGRKPVAYFLTCLALYQDTESNRRRARSYMEPVLQAVPHVKPVEIGLFAGALDYSKLNLVYRTVMKSKMKKQGVPEGDFRDWDAIRSWAEGLHPNLLGT
jgi:menaquinone-dependent protoporphyrinogen oxidase